MSKPNKIKHIQIDITGKCSINTEYIQYIKTCKPYGNEQLSESQLMIKVYDGDKIYINLTTKLAKVYYKKINDVLKGIELVTIEDIKEIKLDISEERGKIYCKINVPAPCALFPHRLCVDTAGVRALLLRRGYKPAAVVQETFINNKSHLSRLEGTWIFAKVVPPPPAKKRTKKSKTTKKE